MGQWQRSSSKLAIYACIQCVRCDANHPASQPAAAAVYFWRRNSTFCLFRRAHNWSGTAPLVCRLSIALWPSLPLFFRFVSLPVLSSGIQTQLYSVNRTVLHNVRKCSVGPIRQTTATVVASAQHNKIGCADDDDDDTKNRRKIRKRRRRNT